MKEINDIAITTEYNGKILMDGRYWLKEYEEILSIPQNGFVKMVPSSIGNNSPLSMNTVANSMRVYGGLGFSFSASKLSTNNLDDTILFANANLPENLIFDPNDAMKYNSFQGLFPVAEGRYLQKTYPVQDGPIASKEFDSYAPLPYRYFPEEDAYGGYYVGTDGLDVLGKMNNNSWEKITSLPPVGTLLYTQRDGKSIFYNPNFRPNILKSYIVGEEIGTNRLILINYDGTIRSDVDCSSELLDFSKATLNGNPLKYPDSLDGQGFSIMCDACDQFVSILFDANRDVGEGIIVKSQNPDTETSEAYVIGIKDVSSAREMETALFKGNSSAVSKII